VRDQLRALEKLSVIDAAAREIDLELREIPARMDEMRGDIQRLEDLLSRERAHLGEAEKLLTSNDEEIARGAEMLGRSKAKAAKARNAREADAVERELEAVRRNIKEREGEKEKLLTAINAERETIGSHVEEFEKLKAVLAGEEEKARARIAELEADRSKVVVGRDEVTVKLQKTVLRRYEMIREKRGIGVVEVKDGICTGCRMQIPAQQFIELQRNESLEQCPHCQRIIFFRPGIED